MKLRFAFTLLCLVALSQITLAQTGTTDTKKRNNRLDYRTSAVFYPFAALMDNFKLGMEHRPNENLGMRAIFLYGYGEDNPLYGNADTYTSFGGEFQVRFYPTGSNPGLFAGFYASGRTINTSRFEYDYTSPIYPAPNVERKYSAGQFGFGVMGGLQGVIAKRFIIDSYIGVGPNIPSGDYKIPSGGYVDPIYNPNPNNTVYIVPGMRKGMRFNLGLNGGVVLFK